MKTKKLVMFPDKILDLLKKDADENERTFTGQINYIAKEYLKRKGEKNGTN